MNWHALHPVTKIFIYLILFSMIVGGIGYILHKFFMWRREQKAQQKTDARKLISYIPVTYDRNGRIRGG